MWLIRISTIAVDCNNCEQLNNDVIFITQDQNAQVASDNKDYGKWFGKKREIVKVRVIFSKLIHKKHYTCMQQYESASFI